MIMNDHDMPWNNMQPGSQRRVKYDTEFEYFWIVDYKRRYGFYLKLNIEEEIQSTISLRGIEVVFNKSEDNFVELFLFLENREEAEVFQTLCYDLIYVIDSSSSDLDKAGKLIDRIHKWKKLLSNRNNLSMSIEKQMGLYAELFCLKNLVAKNYSYKYAIKAWVGMEQDKQDFALDHCVLEVKSHRTTKGNIASISSINQLYSEKASLYLISYGLTISENGQTIDELLDSMIVEIDSELSEYLLIKVFEVGWIPHHDKLKKEHFIVDTQTIYQVRDGFPKVSLDDLDYRISDIRYKIDLSQCKEFTCDENKIFGGE